MSEIFSAMHKIMTRPDKHIIGVVVKESELDNAPVPNNIKTGREVQGVFVDAPKMGERFNIAYTSGESGLRLFSTSPVAEIIYQTDMEVKFKTDNSIYLLVMPK
jgi:hypothetical protein